MSSTVAAAFRPVALPRSGSLRPGSAATGMHLIGIVEIVAGLVVAVGPRFGALTLARLSTITPDERTPR